jgi:hypothetical protein
VSATAIIVDSTWIDTALVRFIIDRFEFETARLSEMVRSIANRSALLLRFDEIVDGAKSRARAHTHTQSIRHDIGRRTSGSWFTSKLW